MDQATLRGGGEGGVGQIDQITLAILPWRPQNHKLHDQTHPTIIITIRLFEH